MALVLGRASQSLARPWPALPSLWLRLRGLHLPNLQGLVQGPSIDLGLASASIVLAGSRCSGGLVVG
jgi:hypothetical protein